MTTDTAPPVLTARRSSQERDPRPSSEQAASGMDQSQPKAPNSKAEERRPAKPRNPAGKIALLVMLLFAGLTVWYAVTDRLAPYSARGSVSAYIAQIAPQVPGQVTEVFVQDNALVDQGAPLFALDRRPFEIAVRQAEAGLAQATQAINASSAALASSQAKVAQAQANLQNVRAAANRTMTLAERGISSKAQADEARANLRSAEAQLAAAEAELRSAEAQLGDEGANNPQIQAAQAQLEQAQLNLLFTTVSAPRRGVVTNLQLSVGQYVGAGSPAMTFIDAVGGWITADFRENQLVDVKPGDPVSIHFDAMPGMVYTGRVDSVAWGIDPGRTSARGLPQNQPETRWFEPARRIPVRIELDGGTANWPHNVRAGSKASVVIYAGGTDGPIPWIARALHRVQAFLSYLY